MSSNNGGKGDDTSYALSIFEKKTLAETRSFTKKCESKIGEDKQNFAAKSKIGLWWDAKGILNCSDVADVTDHMERYEKFYNEIDTFSAQVEKGDPKSYDKLLDIYKDLEEMERDALRDVENNQSSAICLMLREFLEKKYNLDHNLKKVECIVLKQKMSDVEQTCKSSKDAVYDMSKKMDKLIEESRAVRQGNEEKLQQVLEEAEEKNAARIREMRKQNDELRLEAEQRSEAIRRESELKLSELIQENRGIKEIIEIMRKEKEELASEAEKRSEAIRRESDERMKRVLKEAEERSEASLRKMKEENDKLRLEAEQARRESDEQLKKAIEEANRRSEARIQEMAEKNHASLQEMAEKNHANLQKMTKLLENMPS